MKKKIIDNIPTEHITPAIINSTTVLSLNVGTEESLGKYPPMYEIISTSNSSAISLYCIGAHTLPDEATVW